MAMTLRLGINSEKKNSRKRIVFGIKKWNIFGVKVKCDFRNYIIFGDIFNYFSTVHVFIEVFNSRKYIIFYVKKSEVFLIKVKTMIFLLF